MALHKYLTVSTQTEPLITNALSYNDCREIFQQSLIMCVHCHIMAVGKFASNH